MTFFELQGKDVINVEYTAYPTRSIKLDLRGDSYLTQIPLILSGNQSTGRPGTTRFFQDINGNFLSQSYYTQMKAAFYNEVEIQEGMKRSICRIRDTYISSSFYKPENYSSSSIFSASLISNQIMNILTIPGPLIGSGIKPGSFSVYGITANNEKVGTTINDDGYGGLFSASVLIGSIFYEYGLAYLGYKSGINWEMFDVSEFIEVQFSATNHMPMNVYICNAPKGMVNFSTNPSFTQLTGTRNEITTDKSKTFISTIVLYDENFEPVGVAKVANPNLKEEIDGIQYRLKLNF